MQSIATATPANTPNLRKVIQYEFPSSASGASIEAAVAAVADAKPPLVGDKSTAAGGGNKLRGTGTGMPPPSPSEWTVHEHAPQDGGIVPTIAVSLWLGWMAFLIYSVAALSVLGSSRAWAAFLGTCTLSLAVPRDFPAGPGERFAAWIFRHARRYFGLTTVVEDAAALEDLGKLDDGDCKDGGRAVAAIFAFEPHDVLPYPVFALHGSVSRGVVPGTVLSNARALTTSAVFKVPFLRQVYSWTGCAPVDRRTFRAKLKRKESVVFCPGGVQEVTLMDPNRPDDLVLYLRSRRGFVRLALETGSPIVPTFAFHTDGSYGYWFPRGKLVSRVARTIGFLPLLFWGRFGIPFGIPRYRSGRNVKVVIGRPIYVPREGEGNVSEGSVERYHALFLEEMEALFERHKHGAGYGHRTLKIL